MSPAAVKVRVRSPTSDFAKTRIYILRSRKGPLVYVGWTTTTLKKRFERTTKNWAGPSVQVLAQGDCYIEQLEAYPCKSSEAAIARTSYWIDQTPDTVNDLEGTYEGESLEGQPHGRGTFVYAHGATYEGEWVQGKRHGAGRLVQADGGSYVGEWREDMKHGKGKDVFASGWDVASQECQYKKGKMHGPIAVTYADGKAYIGRCDEDENVGLGVKWSADRTQAWEMEGGFTEVRSISPEEAAFIAKSIGLPVP